MAEDFRKLWRGEQPLIMAFLLHFGFGMGLVQFLILILAKFAFGLPDMLAVCLMFAGGLVYAAFTGIGVWRSGYAYAGSKWLVIGVRAFVCLVVAELAFLSWWAFGQDWIVAPLT